MLDDRDRDAAGLERGVLRFDAGVAQGTRVKESSFRDEACEEVVVPCGGFALQAHGAFCGGISHEVARYVFYRGEVGGSVILTDAAFVVAENHVHHPMEAILYRPMIADEWPKNIRQQQ
jgi:hypothetical protein